LTATAGQKTNHWSAAAVTWSAGSLRSGITSAAWWPVGSAGNFGDHFAGLLIVFADRVLPEIGEAFAIHGHPVPLRRIEGADDAAALVDVNHRGRADAAVGNGRIQFRLKLDVSKIVGAIIYPNVVVLVDG
jgi:hypothetical protein